MTTLDSDLKNILEGLGKRLYDIEQVMTGSDVMGQQSNVFDDEIIIVDDLGNPLPISVLGPEVPTDVVVDTDAFFDNIFADVSWQEALEGYDAGSYIVRLFKNEGLGVRTFESQATTGATNYRFNNLEPNTDYSVKVLPLSRIGVPGVETDYIDFTTGQDSTIPPQVQDVSLGRGATSVVVSYTPLDESEAPDVAAGNGIYEVEIATKNTFAEGSYLALSGSESSEPSVATSPSTTQFNQQGDVEHEFEQVVVREWAEFPQGLAAKGSLSDYSFLIAFTGQRPDFFYMNDASVSRVASATANLPYSVGEPFDFKITRQRSNGEVRFYSRPVGGVYTQLGASVFVGAGDNIKVTTGQPLRIGAGTDSLFPFGGSIGRYTLRNGIGVLGAVMTQPDFAAQTPGTQVWTDAIGKVWTISSKAQIEGGYRSTFTNDQVVAFNDVLGDSGWYARVRAIDGSGNIGPWSDVAGPELAGGVTDKMIVADLSAARIKTGYLNASRIQTNTLTADKIATGYMSAAQINLSGSGSLVAESASGDALVLGATGLFLFKDNALMVSLDAVTGNASFKGTITASAIVSSTMTGGSITGGTITGALIQSSTGELTISGDDLIIDTGGSIKIGAPAGGEAFSTNIRQIGTTTFFDNFSAGGIVVRTLVGQDIAVQAGGDLHLTAGGASNIVMSGGELQLLSMNCDVGGHLEANSLSVIGSKAFKIPHPSPGHEGDDLIHASLEGPENGVYYRGRSVTKKKKVTITLPEYFTDLVRGTEITAYVSPIAGENGRFSAVAAGDVEDGRFTVVSQGDDVAFSWLVFAVRGDIEPLVCEVPTKIKERSEA